MIRRIVSKSDAALRRRVVKGAAPAVVFGVALGMSYVAHQPYTVPGIALGSHLLLNIERATAGLGAIGAVWLIGWRALHGHFPIKFGNVEYSEEAEASADAADIFNKRLDSVEASIKDLAVAILLADLVESEER